VESGDQREAAEATTTKDGHMTPAASIPSLADYKAALRWSVSDFCYRYRQLKATPPGWTVARWAKPNATRLADSRAGGKP
jgi:hypothetical protein